MVIIFLGLVIGCMFLIVNFFLIIIVLNVVGIFFNEGLKFRFVVLIIFLILLLLYIYKYIKKVKKDLINFFVIEE